MKVRNILTTFDKFEGKEILTERDVQDYHSLYIDLYNEFRKGKDNEKENINDDLVFEMELIKQVEINIDFILELVKKHHKDNTKNKEILVDINRAIESSIELRNKKDLIEQFIMSLDVSSSVDSDWIGFIEEKKKEELELIIMEENLNKVETYKFIENAFRDGTVATTGTAITKILPKMSRFDPDGQYTKIYENVIKNLNIFFERFFDISKKEM